MDVHLRIRRYDPEGAARSYWDSYDLEMEGGDRVLDALHAVRWHHDPTLGFRRSCAHGVCGSDAMVINGRNRLACTLLLAEVGGDITVEPIRGLPVIKDLIVDMEPFFEQYRRMEPWLQPEDPDEGDHAGPRSERIQSPNQRQAFDDTTRCILCAACTTSCPVFWGNDRFVGPAALVGAHRFVFDSRDAATEERLARLDSATGAWGCRTAFNCTDACPRGIQVTSAIEELKRAVIRPPRDRGGGSDDGPGRGAAEG